MASDFQLIPILDIVFYHKYNLFCYKSRSYMTLQDVQTELIKIGHMDMQLTTLSTCMFKRIATLRTQILFFAREVKKLYWKNKIILVDKLQPLSIFYRIKALT